MSWPDTDVDTTNMDAAADNPGNARADIKQMADNVNEMRAARGTANGIASLGPDALVPDDELPVIQADKGGTGQTAFTVGDIFYADTTSTLALLPAGTAGKTLVSGGPGVAPSWQVAGGFASGTRMPFNQTTAPVGWTKDTTAALNDSLMRIVTGSVTGGGANNFAATVNTQTATASHTLTTAQIPAHTHVATGYQSNSKSATKGLVGGGINVTGPGTNTTTSTGSGGSHNHGITMNIKYNDFIIAQRD